MQTGKSLQVRLGGRLVVLLAIGIIAVSYGLFFYFQGIVEKEFRDSLFEQQKARQVESTKAIAQHIESDLAAISTRLALLAADPSIKAGGLSGPDARSVLEKAYSEMEIGTTASGQGTGSAEIINGLYLVDRNGIVAEDVRAGGGSMTGSDVSSDRYVQETRSAMQPTFSAGFPGYNNTISIAATYPITGPDGQYFGMVVCSMATQPFFQHYGNIYDIKSQYMAVLDTDSVQLVHPVPSLVGTPFFGEYTQNVTGHNDALNSQIRAVMAGKPADSIYEFVNGERFNSGDPIFFHGKPAYFVFIVTPTSVIYGTSEPILAAQRMESFTVLVGTTVAIAVLIFLLARWNQSLNRQVEARTREISDSNAKLVRANSQLEESNKQLGIANEKMIAINQQLERNEKMQREFINVAAHELRTPIQPIIGLVDIMRSRTGDPEMTSIIDTIERNAQRLLHLSSDILDTAQIEGQSLNLNRESVEVNELLLGVVQDYVPQFQARNVRLSFEPGEKSAVMADKIRISQVVSNLLTNAAKFTSEGSVTIAVTRSEQEGEVRVEVKDTGAGIDGDILPRLFTKFATKSEKGTGLGLFISKSIVEAHGGRMWGQNNGSRGATFGFSLPLADGSAGTLAKASGLARLVQSPAPIRAEN